MAKILASQTPTADRVPPGQFLTDKFPVLSYGPTPRFDAAKWDFRIVGQVEAPIRLTYQQFRELPQSLQVSDFHCVTTWSQLDNRWEGVKVADLLAFVRLKPQARFAILHCDGGYTTNLPLAAFLDDAVMLAHRHNGRDITPDHGWPVRAIVPKLYAWKSAKWLRGIEFSDIDKRGFWEVRGYHNDADPWKEERYSFQEDAEE